LPLVVLVVYGRLKRRPMFDSLAVGATWAFVVVFSSVVAASPGAIRDLGGVFLGWFLVAFAGVESRNVPDADGDSQTDRTTFAGILGRRRATALIVLLKSAGVAVFWAVSGTVVAASALGYLMLLRLFRTLTRRETVRSGNPGPEGGLDESGVSTE
jgi:4-hydroxybenzoate polyprenyltransferase